MAYERQTVNSDSQSAVVGEQKQMNWQSPGDVAEHHAERQLQPAAAPTAMQQKPAQYIRGCSSRDDARTAAHICHPLKQCQHRAAPLATPFLYLRLERTPWQGWEPVILCSADVTPGCPAGSIPLLKLRALPLANAAYVDIL